MKASADQRAEGRLAPFWPLLLAGTIILLSGTAALATPGVGGDLPKDKLAHFLIFGLLATSLLRIPRVFKMGRAGVFLTIAAVSAFGGLDEFRQSFTPGRFVEVGDWLADTLGAIVAALLYFNWGLYRRLLEWPLAKRRKH